MLKAKWGLLLVALILLMTATASAQQQSSGGFTISGVSYTKWLWGNMRYDGALYNFTTVPGEGFGDNGQGTELELLVGGKPNKYIEVSGRIHSRFNQNFWTNFGGFGGRNPSFEGNPNPCTGGDCGEYDPRSNQYVKLRGLTMRITPGYRYVDAVTVGASDWGMFDPFTVGKIRYIDRDNGAGLLMQGKFAEGSAYDLARISLPRLWAGPGYSTGDYQLQDAAYVAQFRYSANPMFDFAIVGETVRDVEIDPEDNDWDDGRDVDTRFDNDVFGIRFGIHPSAMFDIRGNFYASENTSYDEFGAPVAFGINGYNPIVGGDADDTAFKLDFDVVDPFQVGLSFNFEYFDIGEQYTSILAARRESDVLLTEGHDGTFAFPGPSNAAYGVFGNNDVTRIGYAGWQGNAQQVATLNVDNDFTDFDEPMAETVIGWKGFTIVPVWNSGAWQLAGELSLIDYNTNWQAWGDASRSITNTIYPATELDTGVGHNFRSAYAPFQDKETTIALVRGKYTLDVANGVELFGKVKWIDETDDRMTDARFLPFVAGDCPGGGAECGGVKNFYSPGNSTGDYFGNPPVITVNGVTGYKWAPFDDLSDDDRDMDYKMYQLGAGYQFTDIFYSSLTYELYDVDIVDGNTALQGYNLHEMVSGQHEKNKLIWLIRFPIGGTEMGFNYEYAFGEFDPDFGGGFVTQFASAEQAARFHVPVGSPGFEGRYGGWNSMLTREFDHQHLKAYLKVRF
jgi:hypothetical protein